MEHHDDLSLLEQNKNILYKITQDVKNHKFTNLAKSELYRAKRFRYDNKNPNPRYFKYKRGCIIFVDFGIGIGAEFSSPHFAIVLDNKDHERKGTLTVIPLTSKDKKNHIDIGTHMIDSLIEKTLNDLVHLNILYSEIRRLKENAQKTKKDGTYYPKDEYRYNLLNDFIQRHDKSKKIINEELFLNWFNEDMEKIKQISDYYAKHKKNTYAKTDAITTISKHKIMRPINNLDPIGKTCLDKTILNIIDTAILKHITKIPIDKKINI